MQNNSKKMMDAYITECMEVIGELQNRLLGDSICGAGWQDAMNCMSSIESASNMMGLDDIQNLSLIIQRAMKSLHSKPDLCSPGHVKVVGIAVDKLKEMVRNAPQSSNISYRDVVINLQKMLGRKLVFKSMVSKSSVQVSAMELGRDRQFEILIVEDNQIVGRLLREKISQDSRFVPVLAQTMAEAKSLLENGRKKFFAAVLDLNLPDAPNGEVVDLVLERGVPSMVLTGIIKEETRRSILAKPVVDYIVKGGVSDLDYVVSVLERLVRNREIKVLVVEDSGVLRTATRRLLNLHCYQVLEAADGEEALEVLIHNPGVLVVITDYMMPNMDGLELVRAIRGEFNQQEMVVIGVSGAEDEGLSARFLKSGANDFLQKPFGDEEFHCRVNQNVEMVLLFKAIQEASMRDYLTGLYNRRHFIETAEGNFRQSEDKEIEAVLAILDVDHFKRVNDTYGHQAGDAVLQRVAGLLRQGFEERGLVARFGGEEFIVLLSGQNAAGAQKVLDVFRKHLEKTTTMFDGQEINVTISIGMALRSPAENLAGLINRADEKLYEAKQQGRNRVVVDVPRS